MPRYAKICQDKVKIKKGKRLEKPENTGNMGKLKYYLCATAGLWVVSKIKALGGHYVGISWQV